LITLEKWQEIYNGLLAIPYSKWHFQKEEDFMIYTTLCITVMALSKVMWCEFPTLEL